MQNLLDELTTAQWLANVGIPLSVAIIALLLAYSGLKRQLEQDRRIARAAGAAAASHRLSDVITDLAEDLATTESRWWNNSSWPGLTTLRSEIEAARAYSVNSEALELLLKVGRTIACVWVSHGPVNKRMIDSREWDDRLTTSGVLSRLLHEYALALKEIADSLRRWDGFHSVPLDAPLQTLAKRGGSPLSPVHDRWSLDHYVQRALAPEVSDVKYAVWYAKKQSEFRDVALELRDALAPSNESKGRRTGSGRKPAKP